MTGIINIISLFWQDMINLLNLNFKAKGSEKNFRYFKPLKQDGIIKIPQFISPELADSLRVKIEELALKNPKSILLENGSKFNYRSEGTPEGPDYGMLDIFNIENLLQEVTEIDQDGLVQLLKKVTGQEVIKLRANAYLNIGIKNTRGYHVDNTQPVVYKAFVYLTDVPNIEYGPYSFIKKSHKFSKSVYSNLFRNLFSSAYRSSDMPRINKNQVVDMLGSKGDLILSNQNGIHRGHPQLGNKKRVALIFSFIVKSKLSYFSPNIRQIILKNAGNTNS
jgi:hypothetical protein